VIGLLGYGVFTAVVGGSTVRSSLRMRVRGVVVDAETGAPLEGAAVRARRSGDEEPRSPTDAAGAFEVVVPLGVSYRTGWSGSVSGRSRESPFEAAPALLVERQGYVPLLHETKDARWTEQREGGIVGTLEVGTIRLTRAE
jgi:hypothetical protein